MNPDRACKCLDNHRIHRCQLDSSKHADLIEALSNIPIVKCEKCGAKANTASYVCIPIELKD